MRSGPPLRWFAGDDDAIDVHSFRALERLAVHAARTEADLMSRVERSALPLYLNLRVMRGGGGSNDAADRASV